MGGIDRQTGKYIETAEHIRQSIELILTTPVGSRVTRHNFGYECLNEDGRLKKDLTPGMIEECAKVAIVDFEPRVDVLSAAALFEGPTPVGVHVDYVERNTGKNGFVAVNFER